MDLDLFNADQEFRHKIETKLKELRIGTDYPKYKNGELNITLAKRQELLHIHNISLTDFLFSKNELSEVTNRNNY